MKCHGNNDSTTTTFEGSKKRRQPLQVLQDNAKVIKETELGEEEIAPEEVKF